MASDATQASEGAPAAHAQEILWGLWWDGGLCYELGSSNWLWRAMLRHPDADVQPYRGKIGAKLHWDAANYDWEDSQDRIRNDSGLRRARLYTTGSFYLRVPVSYKVEAEVANQDFYVREVYLWLAQLRFVQSLKVGHFKAPMTLEGCTSAGDTLFLERASPVEAFGPGVMFGIQPAGTSADKRRTWAFGCFADAGNSDVSEASRSLTRAIGRTTWLPLVEGDGAGESSLIHLGVSGQYMRLGRDDLQFRSRPESYFAPRLVDTGGISADDAVTWGVEFAAQRNSLSLQSEFLETLAYGTEQGDLVFNGWYVAASWLMTGETRPYNRNTGAFGHVVPRRPFSLRDRAFGAWEMVLRFSSLDLDSRNVNGGTMRLATVGLNGHLTTHLRIMFDCATGRVTGGENEGDLQILEGRVQYEL